MKNEIRYEWTVEIIDENDDIIDSFFVDTFAQTYDCALECPEGHIVHIGVVRDRGNDDEGLICRSWAYIDDSGKLPDYFEDATGARTAKVPAKFHKELRA